MKIEPIETERLRLRGFTPADAMFAIGIWNSPDTGEY
ncbi:MAG: N-acetyltransferase, partial [Oscillospiraceae bacterium]|nr:N-acetyltransferase [Oscillospiraceae bacterium]